MSYFTDYKLIVIDEERYIKEEFSNGTKKWYKNGELHREDGPAVEYFDGDKYWYLNGVGYFEEEWRKLKEIK